MARIRFYGIGKFQFPSKMTGKSFGILAPSGEAARRKLNNIRLAGAGGFEPPYARTKILCLTA